MNLLTQFGVSEWARGLRPVNCSAESCNRWLTERQLNVSRVGVSFGQSWYCSYRCASSAMEAALQNWLTPRTRRREAPARPPFGLALVRRGLLSDAQYKVVAEVQRASGEEFGDVAVSLGYVTETEVTESRALHWACPAFAYSPGMSGSSVHIPSVLRERYSMVSMHHVISGNRLFVGFQYGVEYAALFALEQIIGCTTQPCLISRGDFARLHGELLTDRSVEERFVDGCATAAAILRQICQAGRSMDAESVGITRCGEMLWCRLSGQARKTDLLFALG